MLPPYDARPILYGIDSHSKEFLFMKFFRRPFLSLLTISAIWLLNTNPLHAYANEEMIAGQEMGHDMHDHPTTTLIKDVSNDQSSYIISVDKIQDKGPEKLVTFSLKNQATHEAVIPDDLQEVHTKKLHLLIINDALDDYHHIHPDPTANPGDYSFTFTPKPNSAYRMWLDVTPKSTNQQTLIMIDLIDNPHPAKPVEKIALKSTVYPYNFSLSFDQPVLKAGQAAIGKIMVRDSKQRPVKTLEPVMGTFAHIVAFSSDFKTVSHAHPMGSEPKSLQERGGPILEFHFEPTHPGFVKLYAQIKINGQDVFVPFGFFVK